ncbi:MAG: hypothetical protein Q8920_11885, partial [Bacillota bacterium]|nr:hypothetical protein [Bacillota bacterium]
SRAEQSSEQYSEEDWGNLVKKKSFFLDFNTDIKADLLSAFLNIDSSSIKELSGVYKIIILPWEDVNNNVIFYITDGQRINKYTLPITSKDMSRDDYQKIFDNLEQSDQRQYCTINGLDPAKKTDTYSSVGQDIFFARGSMFNDYYTLYSYVPDSLKIKTSNIKEIDALENSLLDDEKDFYDFAVSSYDNSIVMKDMNNTYRIHNDGLLEYKYVSAADDQEKLQVSKAFQNAVDFISKIKQLVQGNGIVLSGIDTDSKDYVEFTFDYMVNNVPVVADYGLTGNDGQVLHNAITVRATSSRVINAWCILKKFDTGTITDKYNVNFPDFLSNQFKDYKNLANDKKFFIRNVNISYVILSAGDKQTLQPEWVIYASDGKYFEIPARKKGGD